MIDMVPVADLVPQDYRYALDAAMPLLVGAEPQLVICHLPNLSQELAWRLPNRVQDGCAEAALWIEPPATGWRDELGQVAATLPAGADLAVIASHPLAWLLPERQGWPDDGLGQQPGGIRRLQEEMRVAGFRLREIHGIHTLWSIVLNKLSLTLELRWPARADQLHFAARQHYCMRGRSSALATISLLFASKETAQSTLFETARKQL